MGSFVQCSLLPSECSSPCLIQDTSSNTPLEMPFPPEHRIFNFWPVYDVLQTSFFRTAVPTLYLPPDSFRSCGQSPSCYKFPSLWPRSVPPIYLSVPSPFPSVSPRPLPITALAWQRPGPCCPRGLQGQQGPPHPGLAWVRQDPQESCDGMVRRVCSASASHRFPVLLFHCLLTFSPSSDVSCSSSPRAWVWGLVLGEHAGPPSSSGICCGVCWKLRPSNASHANILLSFVLL